MKQTDSLQYVVDSLLNHQVGIFPCDTIWGLIAIPSEDTIQKLKLIKKRDPKKNFIYLINSFKQLNDLVKPLTVKQKCIVNRYWPGAVTFIFNQKNTNKTIAIRYPNMVLIQTVIKLVQSPIISTSVNISSQKSCNNKDEFPDEIVDKIDFLFKTDKETGKKASTIVDLTSEPYKVLRQGCILFND